MQVRCINSTTGRYSSSETNTLDYFTPAYHDAQHHPVSHDRATGMRSILFVDDEKFVLDGLRTRLHRLHNKWKMEFVASGALALEHMQDRPSDVIVTDAQMPSMNGAKLLETVSGRWPQTIRIVLSGSTELAQTTLMIPFAHQYLSKPCEPQQLENVIDRCLLLHELLNQPHLRAIVGRIRSLPSLPTVYVALQSIVKDESVTLSDVAKIISADSALAARVLQMVNSAFFRHSRRISNIEAAVSYLGFQTIRNLSTSIQIFSRWQGCSCAGLNLDELQTHALAVAAAVRSLTVKTPICDDAMLAGLLHDIGYWILAQECPEDLGKAVSLAASENIPLYAAETRLIGASHAEIGAYLLGIWGLPYPVVEAVAHHHQPERITQSSFDVLGAVVLAHSLTPADDASAFGSRTPADPKVDENYLVSVKAPFDWNEAVERVAEVNDAQEHVT
jgi:HD-like signal output (HDOD) protein/ActR/RegA family two-component response regulator